MRTLAPSGVYFMRAVIATQARTARLVLTHGSAAAER
jgi:hypothetical protein